MVRNNKLKIALYFMLFGLTCCYIFQLYYNNKTKKAQLSSVELQEILNLSDDVGSHFGSIQQNFRINLLTPSAESLYQLKVHQIKFDSVLNAVSNLSSSYPKIHSYLSDLNDLYTLENKSVYLNKNLPKENPKEIIEKSESSMNALWSQLWDFKINTKALLKENNVEIINNLKVMETLRFVSLFFTVGLIIILYIFYSNFRKVAYKASYSSKSVLSNQILLMKSLLDTTTTIMYIIDSEGKYLFANNSFLDFFELKENDVIGKKIHELDIKKAIKFENNSTFTDSTSSYLEKEEITYVDGNKLHFFTRKFPIKNNKNEIFASGVVCRNITERILNEDGLKKSRHDAEQAKLTQEQFMANISHEIRTPMNGIIGMTNLLSKTSLTEDQIDYLETISQSSENLMVLINDILDFSKIEAGKLELEVISFKISDVVAQVSFPLKEKAKEKNIDFNIKIDHKVPLKVLGDPLRLNQILTNIIANAIKFTNSGSVNVTVSAESYISPLINIIFKIEDTGIGIPKDRIDYIFQSFTQTSIDVTRKFGGTGLGLAIVKQLVELHSGIIYAESEENKGSVFTIQIPYKPTISGERTIEENSKFDFLKDKKVLVVEDNFINQKVIVQTLKNAGINSSLADNGFTALELLKSQSFDIVIMDIQMPEIDGCETTKRIREELKLNIPIIAMTASAMQEDRDKCRAVGMNEYISKPFVTEDLLEKLLLFS